MSTRDDDDGVKAAMDKLEVYECVDWLVYQIEERAARNGDAGATGSGAGSHGGSVEGDLDDGFEEDDEEEEEEEEEDEDEDEEEDIDEEDEQRPSASGEDGAREPSEVAAPAEAVDASKPLTKREAAQAAFKHLKFTWGTVHAHPSLDDEHVNTMLAHVAASNLMPAKDLFLMLCDIEGVVLIVTPRLLSTQPEESFHNALACDNIAHVGGVDVRILTPLLIHCSTEAARLQLTAAVSGVEAYIGEWSLLCGRPVVLQEGVVELGLSLQVC